MPTGFREPNTEGRSMTLVADAGIECVAFVDACRRAGLTRPQLMRRIMKGEIAAEMRFGRWVVSVTSLEAFLRDHAA